MKLVHENNGVQHVVYTLYPFNFVVGGHHVMTECYLLMKNEKKFSYIMVRPGENDCRFPLTRPGQIFTAGYGRYLLLPINKINKHRQCVF